MQDRNQKNKKSRLAQIKLAFQIFLIAFALSTLLSFASQSALSQSTILFSFFVLLFIIVVGVIFDIIGVAIAAAQTAPFNAMASKKNEVALIALKLIRRASLVATFSNDVVGDIAGIVSGAAVASIVFRISASTSFEHGALLSIVLSGLAAGLTVGGKAYGKELALKQSKQIVYLVAKVLYHLKKLFSLEWILKR